MKIRSVNAYRVHIPIPPEKQHTSDFGRHHVVRCDPGTHRHRMRHRRLGRSQGAGRQHGGKPGDAHGTFSVAEAKRFCRLVEDRKLTWFEEPVTADDKAGCPQVRAATDIPIAAGESEFTRRDFRDLAMLGTVDIFQPDLAICGGILWAGAPALAAGLHVAATSPAGFILEYSLGANPLLHELVEEAFPVRDGVIEIPDRPRLGITIREDFLAAHIVK